MRPAPIFMGLLLVVATLTGCGALGGGTGPATPTPDGLHLAPLMVDPPESAKAARASEATYGVYEGVACGVVPRPDQGYTLRYPKIWIAREQGRATWRADSTENDRPGGGVR